MFEQEIKETQNKLIKTLLLWREAEKIEKKIDRAENILYLHIRKDCIYNLYEQATNEIKNKVRRQLDDSFVTGYSRNKKEFKEFCERVKNINNSDILNKLKEYLNNNYNIKHGLIPIINKNSIIIYLSSYKLSLLLSCLNILINNEIEKTEIIDLAYKSLKENSTFIYRNIKITVYKNGKVKLVFADNNILEIFKDKMIRKGQNDNI